MRVLDPALTRWAQLAAPRAYQKPNNRQIFVLRAIIS